MKKLAILILGLIIISGVMFSASDFKMVKNLTIKSEEVHVGSIMSIGGTIHIQTNAKLQGSIILFGGTLTIDGQVAEDVICVSSTANLEENAFIGGDFYVIAGTLNHPSTNNVQEKIKGEYLNFKFDLKKIESTLLPIFSDSQSMTFFKILKIAFWFIVTLIVFAIVPVKINMAEEIFRHHILKISAMGIITLFTFVFLLFLFIILSFIIIGIPLLFLLVIAYFVTYIFGRTVMFYTIGTRLTQKFNIKQVTPALFIVIGTLVYALLKFIPVLGPVLLIILNICELGIGIGFFFRKKLKLAA